LQAGRSLLQQCNLPFLLPRHFCVLVTRERLLVHSEVSRNVFRFA
jgi:hypothetical protein